MISYSIEYQLDDWVSCSNCARYCQGYYHEPILPSISETQSHTNLPLYLTADSAQLHLENSSALKGHVCLTQGNRKLLGDYALIASDPKTHRPQQIHVEGHVQLLQPHCRIDADTADWSIPDNIKVLNNTALRLYDRHAHGYAKETRIIRDQKFHLTALRYSTCNPLHPTWELKAKEAKLDTVSGRGKFYHASLLLKGIPIIYTPYLNIPLDDRRQTGFLYPSLNGSTITLPFYWNVAPHYDMTITPKWYPKKNSYAIEDQLRYLLPHHQGVLKINYLPHDKEYESFRLKRQNDHPGFANHDPRIRGLTKGPERYSVNFMDTGHLGPHLKSFLNYERASDDNYFVDLGDTLGLANHTYLTQEARLEYHSMHTSATARFQDYQTLHPYYGATTQDIYRRLPQLGGKIFSGTHILPFQSNVEGEFTHFLYPSDPMSNKQFPEGSRYYIRPSISLPLQTPGWEIQPRLQWDIVHYSLIKNRNLAYHTTEQFTRSLPILDCESKWLLERPVLINKRPFFQTLEPKIYYLRIPFKEQSHLPVFDSNYSTVDYYQLFRDNRFNGRDRLGDTEQLSFGFVSRLLDTSQHTERLRINLGQILYFRDRKVTVCNNASPAPCTKYAQEIKQNKYRHSSIVGLLYYQLADMWGLNGGIEWNPNTKQTDRQTIMTQYHAKNANIFNFGYQYLRTSSLMSYPVAALKPSHSALQQVFTSAAWHVGHTPFRFLGSLHFNLKEQRTNELWFGLEYQGCCNTVRLVTTRYLRPYTIEKQKKYDTKIFLQFVFNGLGGIGSQQIDNILNKNIPGYKKNAFH